MFRLATLVYETQFNNFAWKLSLVSVSLLRFAYIFISGCSCQIFPLRRFNSSEWIHWNNLFHPITLTPHAQAKKLSSQSGNNTDRNPRKPWNVNISTVRVRTFPGKQRSIYYKWFVIVSALAQVDCTMWHVLPLSFVKAIAKPLHDRTVVPSGP